MRYLFTTFVVLSACTGGTNLCERVTCPGDRVCEAATGRCLPGDAGTPDAGTPDAGEPDAGRTGCEPPCSAAQRCDVAANRCVQCLADSDCSCPTPACSNNFCIGRPPDDGGIKPALPSAESCAAAAPSTVPGCELPRSYRFRVNLNGNDDEQGICSARMGLGRDFVYVLRLDATYDLKVDVTPTPGSPAQPVVYIRRMPCGGQELACSDTGAASSVLLRSRTAGDYAVIVDTRDAAGGGEVEVAITLSAPTEPPNDTCLSAEPIPTDGGVVTVDLSLARNDEAVTCNMFGVDSRDVAWTFTLPATADIVARAERADPRTGVSPFIELRHLSCGPGTAKACTRPNAAGQSSLRLRSAAAGQWYLVVEAFDGGASGPVDVSVSVQPPSPPLQHDTCAAPLPLVFTDGGTFLEFEIDTSTAADDEDGTCRPGTGAEYVYRLNLVDPKRVAITASPAPGSPADPILYVRQSSCTAGVELGCSDVIDGGVAEFVSSGAGTWAPGDYFIFIDSYNDDSGPIHVTVFVGP